MSQIVYIADYGLGNLFSVAKAIQHVGFEPAILSIPPAIHRPYPIIIPGVGAFGAGMKGLQERGWDFALRENVERGGLLLGVCLGMQLLFETSEELGVNDGLGFLKGTVREIPTKNSMTGQSLKIPHTGWSRICNSAARKWSDTILDAIPEEGWMYFVHSFAAHPVDEHVRLADTEYGGHRISAVVQSANVFGCQFHPEKSGELGLHFLRNFCRLAYTK